MRFARSVFIPLLACCFIWAALPTGARAQEGSPAMPAALAETDAVTSAALYDQYAGEKFNNGLRSRKKVALTFDDGPHPRLTSRVVEILKKEEAHATFFWLGEMIDRNPDTARMVIDAGFEVGNHSQSHANLVRLEEKGVRGEIEPTGDKIERLRGAPTRLFRPPYGNTNRTVQQICRANGLVMCLWSIDTRDWTSDATPDSIARTVLSNVKGGDVILMHDIHAKTVEALPRIVRGLKDAGYELVTMGQLVEESAAAPPEERKSTPAPAAASSAPVEPPVMSLQESSQY